jgi:hypothetical protein
MAWWHPFGIETRPLSSIRCTVMYQGVATPNGANTREILAHRTGARPNFVLTEFSEVRSWKDSGYSHRPNTTNATPTTVAAMSAAIKVATNKNAILARLSQVL